MDEQELARVADELDGEWIRLLGLLPSTWEDLVKRAGALQRRRRVRDAPTLLRLVLAYGYAGMSLQAVVAWAAQKGIAQLTDAALLKRLRKAPTWLGELVSELLSSRHALPRIQVAQTPTHPQPVRRIILVDGTALTEQGVAGTGWRVHLAYELPHLQVLQAEPTPASDGETLARFRLAPGDVVACDRGFAHRAGLHALVRQQAYVVVRINWQNLPLEDAQGQAFDILAFLRGIDEEQVAVEVAVQTAPDRKKGIPAIPGRLVALRKSPEATERARHKAHTDAKKKGRTPDARTLEACAYLFVFTTVPAEALNAGEVLRLYRFRWQIELAIKRMKSLMRLDEMRAHDPQLCRAFLLGKLLVSLLVEDLANHLLACPVGVDAADMAGRAPPVSLWRVVQALALTLKQAIARPVSLLEWGRTAAQVPALYADPYDKRPLQTIAARSIGSSISAWEVAVP